MAHETPGGQSKLGDSNTLQAANDVLTGRSKKNLLARLLPFMGPAFIASVAYMDPGNFATNIQAGAQYGYMLLWVVVLANEPAARADPGVLAGAAPGAVVYDMCGVLGAQAGTDIVLRRFGQGGSSAV